MAETEIVAQRGDSRIANTRLTVDLDALAANYRLLSEKSGNTKTAGVVKANAYGLGLKPVAETLANEGCERFFVALISEGVELRGILPEAEIYVLSGVMDEASAAVVAEARLIPVLNSMAQIETWARYWRERGSRKPCAIHADTGMNRLGLSAEEAVVFGRMNVKLRLVTPILIMSHLACADDPDHPLNRQQIESFQRVRAEFADIESSIANSAGIFLGDDFHLDVTRPGIALYGGTPGKGAEGLLKPVAKFEARILQVRNVSAGESVSYGATHTFERDSVIAVAGAGYADGLLRSSSASGVPLRETGLQGATGFIKGNRVPAIGRVTMDQAMFDITDLPEDTMRPGDWIELFGPNIPIDEAAQAAGTISYELLTSCARRAYTRHISKGSSS